MRISDEVHLTPPVTLWECQGTRGVSPHTAPSTLKSLDTYTVAITPPPPSRYVYMIHDSSLPSLGMHTPYMCTPPPLPVCVSRACRGVLSRAPSHVYVFPLTVVTCPLTSVTCDFFFF